MVTAAILEGPDLAGPERLAQVTCSSDLAQPELQLHHPRAQTPELSPEGPQSLPTSTASTPTDGVSESESDIGPSAPAGRGEAARNPAAAAAPTRGTRNGSAPGAQPNARTDGPSARDALDGAEGSAPVAQRRRRRSSWTAGEWPQAAGGSAAAGAGVAESTGRGGGLESLSRDDLFRQFVAIRDAVVRKASTSGGRSSPASPRSEAAGAGAGEESAGAVERRGEGGVWGPEAGARSALRPCSLPGTPGPVVAPVPSTAGSAPGTPPAHPLSHTTYAHSPRGSASGSNSGAGAGAAQANPGSAGVGAAGSGPSPLPRTSAPGGSPTHRPTAAVSPSSLAARRGLDRFPDPLATSGGPGLDAETQGAGTGQGAAQAGTGSGTGSGTPWSPTVVIDLQQFYRSPAPSTGGSGAGAGSPGPVSPFQAAVSYASGCVGGPAASPSPSPAHPHPQLQALEGPPRPSEAISSEESEADGRDGQMLPGPGSVPATDSLFSLQPSGTPQPSVPRTSAGSAPEGAEAGVGAEVEAEAGEGGSSSSGGGGGQGSASACAVAQEEQPAARMLVWQEELAAAAEAARSQLGGSSLRRRTTSNAGNGPLRSNTGTGLGRTVDYSAAVHSAAAGRTSLTSVPPTKAAAADDGSTATPFMNFAAVPGGAAANGGGAAGGVAAAAALLTSPSMVASSASTVAKCLDKGLPFAAMPFADFAAATAAAERGDCPAAHAILSSKAVYYPGHGRHAASTGGAGGAVSAGGAAPGGGLLAGRRPATSTATAAAAAIRKLLDDGVPLHVMSPCEYQRIALASQYGVRQLADVLVAVPPPEAATATAAAISPSATPARSNDGTPAPAGPPAGSPAATSALAPALLGRLLLPALPPQVASLAGRRPPPGHRRGSSIGSDDSFTACVVRFQSGREAYVDRERGASTPLPAAAAASPAQQAAAAAAGRMRALVRAAQQGNAARVAYLVEHGADVNATEGAHTSSETAAPHSPRTPHGRHLQALSLGAHGPPATATAAAPPSPSAVTPGRTALHYAAEAGAFAAVQMLLHYGAFVGVRDGAGRNAYDLARRKGHDAVAQLLKDAAERRRTAVRSCTASAAADGAKGDAHATVKANGHGNGPNGLRLDPQERPHTPNGLAAIDGAKGSPRFGGASAGPVAAVGADGSMAAAPAALPGISGGGCVDEIEPDPSGCPMPRPEVKHADSASLASRGNSFKGKEKKGGGGLFACFLCVD
ncbi:hypothetical protein HYH03_011748 [Edaphochlamys debaryana]|uniref:Uncharacterized protein n=1 Tax=Edaphochlamys debaryana TaxID=47281 RepID=A0A835Y2B9_9CHLO|nr:hypothetical protein HYH03_011748 [Edaphochlamys debaryana]|eukprot:KAG2489799.1 hypothetical protein HYH03_011748 [Edaphochlamys debaryana]